MIFSKERDPRLITVRRGGALQDADHHLLALWAADCAEHVLPFFEQVQPGDDRPRRAIALVRAWVRGEVKMSQSRAAAGHANAAARDLSGPAREAAFAAAQAAAVAHVADHALGAAAYAVRAARAAASGTERAASAAGRAASAAERDEAGRAECRWQRVRLPEAIRDLVLDDQRRRNALCWLAFDC